MNVFFEPARSMNLAIFLMGLSVGVSSVVSYGQVNENVPVRAEGIGVDEHLGSVVPMELIFEDEKGQLVKLDSLFAKGKPVILTLNYSDCPGLCVAQIDGLVRGVEELFDVRLGADFQVVSISIDPRESAERAQATKDRYTKYLEGPHDAKGWHFWRGTPKGIKQITEAVGFRYTYDRLNNRYNHAAVAVFLSPEGKITRYLYDVAFEPSTLKMALIEASEGKIGTPLESFLLWCMHYDASENRYSADAKKLLSLAAGAFVLIVLGSTAPFWFARRSTDRLVPLDASDGSNPLGSENSSKESMNAETTVSVGPMKTGFETEE